LEHLFFLPLGSLIPTRLTDDLYLVDDPMSLLQFALVLILENAKANMPQQLFILVETAIVSNGLL
jgi:hypothetical protein